METRKKPIAPTLDDLPTELIQHIAAQDSDAARRLKLSSWKYYHALDTSFFKKAFGENLNEPQKFMSSLIKSAIRGIFNYINERDENDPKTPSHIITHYDKGYHRAFCFLNILQCPPAPKDSYREDTDYIPLTDDQKLMVLYVLLNEKNGARLKEKVAQALQKCFVEHNKPHWTITNLLARLQRQYGADTLENLQAMLLEQIHKISFGKFYAEDNDNGDNDRYGSRAEDFDIKHQRVAHLYRDGNSLQLASRNNPCLYTSYHEQCWSQIFAQFDQELKLKKLVKTENEGKRCHIM